MILRVTRWHHSVAYPAFHHFRSFPFTVASSKPNTIAAQPTQRRLAAWAPHDPIRIANIIWSTLAFGLAGQDLSKALALLWPNNLSHAAAPAAQKDWAICRGGAMAEVCRSRALKNPILVPGDWYCLTQHAKQWDIRRKASDSNAGSGTLCQADGSDSEVEDPPGSRSHTGVNPTMMNPGFGGRQHVYALFVSRKIKRSILPHWTNDAHRGVKCVWLFWKPLQVFLLFFFGLQIPDDSRWFQM